MRYVTVVGAMSLAALAVVLCWLSPARATPTDSLWLKAVALYEKNDDLVPGSMRTHMQEVDKQGEPKDETKYYETWGRLSPGEDGTVEFETVKVIEDGEDVTNKKAEEREEEAEDDGESHEMKGYKPFNAESQERMAVKRVESEQVVRGRPAVLYEFAGHTEDDEEVTGKAWLEAETGIPIRVEYTVDPLPKHVKRMVTTMDYEHFPPDSLIVSHMFVEATGGILFIKKHFHMNMTFTDYWRRIR